MIGVASVSGWLVLIVSTLVLVGGWILGSEPLKNVLPGTVAMKASTAVALVCSAAAALLLLPGTPGWRRLLGTVLATIPISIGLLFLSEYALGWNLGIDELPFRDEAGRAEGVAYPGRLAPTTAVNLVLVGLALITLDHLPTLRWRIGEILVLPVAVISMMSLIGYLYGIPAFYGPASAAKMALNTAVCFLLLSALVVAARPHGRLLHLATTDAPGGVLARRLAPIVIVLPLLFGVLRIEATDAGLFGDSVGTWWLTAATIAAFLLVLGLVASRMNTMDGARRELEGELYELANRDALTGLFNRRRFREEAGDHAKRTRRRGGRTALVILDLDSLKEVNDRYGHLAGDALIAQVGEVMRREIRSSDIAARLGGDEFGVLLLDPSEKGALQVAENLRHAVEAIEMNTSEGSYGTTVSAGVAFSAEPLADDGAGLLAGADDAMYEAKRAGGNRVRLDRNIGMREAAAPKVRELSRINRQAFEEQPSQSRGDSTSEAGPESSSTRTRAPLARLRPANTLTSRKLMLWALPLAALVATLEIAALLIEGVSGHVLTATMVVGLDVLLASQVYLIFRRAEAERIAAETHRAHGTAAVEGALDCVITIDAEGIVQQWNNAACSTFGYSKEEAIGRDLAELIVPPEHRERHRRGVAATVEGDHHGIIDRRMEVSAVHARGGQFPVELTVTKSQSDPPMFTAFVRDISEQRRREQENERLAAIVRSSEDAIFSKDLNGVVTAWNAGAEKIFGYSADEAVGRRLVDLTIPPSRVDEVGAVRQRVLEGDSAALVTQRHTKGGETIDVSLRAFPIRNLSKEIVGISISAHDITENRRRAERERYTNEQKLWRRRIEEALAHDRFMFWGQPVVDVKTGAVHHHELLLRMQLEDRVVSPFEFLPHAESCNLITEIDRWAITTGVQHGREGMVAINLSAKGLSTPKLVDFVEEALLRSRTPASNVLFEITETAAVENLDEAHSLVEELKALGCGAALDDFGTGYGSFTYLKHLPVTELKVDMSFVRGLLADEVDQRIVRSIIHVAENFAMTTVAEGVEDEETLNLLIQMGVDLVQGYHLGRPRPLPNPTGLAMASPSQGSVPDAS